MWVLFYVCWPIDYSCILLNDLCKKGSQLCLSFVTEHGMIQLPFHTKYMIPYYGVTCHPSVQQSTWLNCKTKFWSILPVVSSCAEPISTYSMHWNRDSCTAITFSTKVDQLIDAIITLWNYIIPPKSSQRVHDCCFPPGVCLHVLEGHIGIVRCLYLQGSRLISGGDRKRVVVWNVKVREILLLQPYIQQSFIHCCTSQWVFLHDNGYIRII